MGIKEDEAKLAEWVKTGNDAVDAQADSLLEKVKNSNRTAAILGIGAASILVLIMFAWLVG